jgi:hypothetical protein
MPVGRWPLACAAVGLRSASAELLRLGENALFHLPGPAAVVRIARSADLLPDVRKEVAVARWLEAIDFSAVRMLPGVDQALVVEGRPVTFWRYIEAATPSRRWPSWERVLQGLHALELPGDLALPPLDPLDRVPDRIEGARGSVSEADRTFLLQRLEQLRAEWDGLRFELPPGHVHGDAPARNLLRAADGQVVLLDLERFAQGAGSGTSWCRPRNYLTFEWSTAEEYRAFVRAYGYDVTDWSGFRVLRSVRELTMTTWLMQNVGHDGQSRQEFANWMVSLRNEGERRRWQPF